MTLQSGCKSLLTTLPLVLFCLCFWSFLTFSVCLFQAFLVLSFELVQLKTGALRENLIPAHPQTCGWQEPATPSTQVRLENYAHFCSFSHWLRKPPPLARCCDQITKTQNRVKWKWQKPLLTNWPLMVKINVSAPLDSLSLRFTSIVRGCSWAPPQLLEWTRTMLIHWARNHAFACSSSCSLIL